MMEGTKYEFLKKIKYLIILRLKFFNNIGLKLQKEVLKCMIFDLLRPFLIILSKKKFPTISILTMKL